VKAEDAFDAYNQAVFRFAYRMTRSAETAEDITQECFLALIRTPERFDSARASLKTYLLAIARNLALKNYRDGRGEEFLGEEQAGIARDDPERIELAGAVERAVAELPALQQEALVLFEYEGLTLEEISQVAGADIGAIKSRLHRARERLREVLAPYRGVIRGTSQR
jgi:RNA polymerase sigma-70 factor (ECF subfamily)